MTHHEKPCTAAFDIITPETPVPPVDSAVAVTFKHDDEIIARADSVRFTGFGKWHDDRASITWLDSKGETSSMPLDIVPGLTYLGDDENDYPIVALNYFKQEVGAENFARIVRLTGVAYGVHSGHRGVPEKSIPSEKPGWYIVGEQVGVSTKDGDIEWQQPADRVFPFARIVDGPLGDPRAPRVQDCFGLY